MRGAVRNQDIASAVFMHSPQGNDMIMNPMMMVQVMWVK
jgi:hypothetical protein